MPEEQVTPPRVLSCPQNNFWYFTCLGESHKSIPPTPRNGISSHAGRGSRLGWEGLPCWQEGPVHPSEQRQWPLTWLQVALLKQWQVWLQFWPYLFSWHAAGEQSRQEWWELQQPGSYQPSQRLGEDLSGVAGCCVRGFCGVTGK